MRASHCTAPGRPFFVMIWMTPAAASAPYSVAAAGPLMTSMDSMSSGLMASSAEVLCPNTLKLPVPPLLMRTPST